MAKFLQQAAARSARDPVRLSIRDLLAYWGAYRRGYWVVARIESDLAEVGLRTDPPFADGWIDSEVSLLPLEDTSPTQIAEVSIRLEEPSREVSLKVGSLESANAEVVGVQREDSLELAQTLMMRYDFSQLSVMSGRRDLVGALSWESIAHARLLSAEAGLRDAIRSAVIVSHDDDLIPLIPRIVNAGFVFVRGKDRSISGIVTTADLSSQFAALAGPFLLIGEIERRLRRVLDREFSPEELQAVVVPADSREVESAENLSLGEAARLCENRDNWKRLCWPIDRVQFVEELHEVREIRNDVMHFGPDPLDAEQVARLHRFIKWLRTLDPTP